MSKRIFIAINLPEDIKNELVKVQADLDLPGIKLVEKENLHLTLAFLGEIKEEKIATVSQISKSVIKNINSFFVELSGLGVFPHPERPRIVWVAMDHHHLDNLVNSLRKELTKEKLFDDIKPFSAHLTLARIKYLVPETKNIIKQLLQVHKNQKYGTIKIETIEIMGSELAPSGPIYKILQKIPLNN